jgi:hypothetical protein
MRTGTAGPRRLKWVSMELGNGSESKGGMPVRMLALEEVGRLDIATEYIESENLLSKLALRLRGLSHGKETGTVGSKEDTEAGSESSMSGLSSACCIEGTTGTLAVRLEGIILAPI